MNYAFEDDRKSLENITLDLYIGTHTLTHRHTEGEKNQNDTWVLK